HGLDELRVTPDYLYTAQGERIDVLYKLYPTEYLIEDEAEDGTAVGLALLALVRKRRLMIINPPSAFVLQSKALLALLWTMHLEHHPLFTPQEHQWIAQYVLPTYFQDADAASQPLLQGRYVIKPVYGREGASITLRDKDEIIEQSEDNLYSTQQMIYQQYVQLPTTVIQTEEGDAEVSLVHNCFVVAGAPSAIGVRASHKLIFDDTSYFLPIYYPQ
ncbi:MAG: glutathionylspermidine synthase family protein, partial [Ktedonobacteraceae bacterium]